MKKAIQVCLQTAKEVYAFEAMLFDAFYMYTRNWNEYWRYIFQRRAMIDYPIMFESHVHPGHHGLLV